MYITSTNYQYLIPGFRSVRTYVCTYVTIPCAYSCNIQQYTQVIVTYVHTYVTITCVFVLWHIQIITSIRYELRTYVRYVRSNIEYQSQ